MIGLHDYDRLKTIPKPGSTRDPLRKYRSRVPEGKSGEWSVTKYDIPVDLTLLRMMRDGRGTPPGNYTRLCRGNVIVMSDTNAEIDDLRSLFRCAEGRVLIHGLGLGIAVCGLLQRKDVAHIDVVEKSQNVIKLVAPHIHDDRLHIHRGDCMTFKWPSGARWDWVWHDIWDTICADNLPEMRTLGRKFARRCGQQEFWGRDLIRE